MLTIEQLDNLYAGEIDLVKTREGLTLNMEKNAYELTLCCDEVEVP